MAYFVHITYFGAQVTMLIHLGKKRTIPEVTWLRQIPRPSIGLGCF